MNRQRRILIAASALIWLSGEISDSALAAAASHYPLWVAYAYPYTFGIYVHECGYGWVPR
jgi:hypothetical protein